MHENPYTGILSIMDGVAKEHKSPIIQVGTITAPPPSIRVKYKGIELTEKETYISEYLLSGYTRHMVGATRNATGGSGYAEYASHNHPIDNDETWTDTLKAGDKVAIMPIEAEDETNQQYIILDKIVRPDRRMFK